MSGDVAYAEVPQDPWEGWDDLSEPPDDESAVTAAERAVVDPDDFWKARPVLSHLHDFARSRRVGPWAVLGAALTRIVCAVSPEIQLPATIGTNASLNLFVGLVGESGDGKNAAIGVARDALYIENESFMTAPLGSGEGLSHMFMRQGKATKDDPYPDPQQYNRAALVTIGEIDSMAALVSRQSSTVASQLRMAAMGEQLGFFYADASKRMIVPEHQYRLCLVTGIQPARSEILLGDGDGGTPQRFVWLPAGDPGATRHQPPPPNPMIWQPPDWSRAERAHARGVPRFLITLPQVVADTIIDARVARLQGKGERLDSHAILTRTKVAAALAILDGRTVVDEADWSLSGVIMTVSDTQRARCQRALTAEAEKANVGKALAEADRGLIVEEHVDKVKVGKCVDTVKRLLRVNGPLQAGELRRRLKATHREYLEPALDALTLTGEVVAEATTYRGQPGKRFKLVEKTDGTSA